MKVSNGIEVEERRATCKMDARVSVIVWALEER
jgi:hypothetical protein